jgi:type VI secretion system protein ImpH
MASTDRQTPTDIEAVRRFVAASLGEGAREEVVRILEGLQNAPESYDFFYILRCMDAAATTLPRIGSSRRLDEDFFRFAQRPFLHFASRNIEKLVFKKGDERARAQLFVNFFGLFGPNGPLPVQITEQAMRRELGHEALENGRGAPPQSTDLPSSDDTPATDRYDFSLSAFANIFHHRMVSLFYRAWAVNQPVVDLDRPDTQRFPEYVGSFFGVGMESLRKREEQFADVGNEDKKAFSGAIDWPKLFFAGRLASQVRNEEGLQAILSYYFEVPIAVRSFFGRWIKLPFENQCRLGESPATGRLGDTAIAGERVWDCQLGIRIIAGPLTFTQFRRFLPGGQSFERVSRWILGYIGSEFFWDLQLILQREEVPQSILGVQGLLGWTTWLKSRRFETDPGDLILNGA